ncbi:MAG: asparagine synthase (glutamine-hydrolyzing) [Oligoflexia bacterium]|nr:asparagine synthase (glutamine-hydrolyzing) [Oligoflexia bacterium]
MCGIVGIISLKEKPIQTTILKQMCDVIAHRGPNDAGYFVAQSGHQIKKQTSYSLNFSDSQFSTISPLLPIIDSDSGRNELESEKWNVFLGHRRLSIIDLSPTGHQPMSDKSKSIWIAFNGMIYNFKELRSDLQNLGYVFKSKTDTEIILYAYQEWGNDCVLKFNGMFAFAIWDNVKKVMFLARDRYGIKPLYYTIVNNIVIFSSEIKSILQYEEYNKELNPEALNEYFTFQNLFRNETLFKNIFILPPAHFAIIDFNSGFKLHQYWDFDFTQVNETLTFEEAAEETVHLLKKAVNRQIVADVPVGCYLSGGMDSGSIVAIASRSINRLTSFTAGFELSKITGVEATFDERRDAELMANEFKTEHYEQIINAGDISWVLPKLIYHLEDLRVGMCYSNYYISRLASKFVKVCLSGTGGDELYGGYPWRYYRVIHSLDKDQYFNNYYHFWKRLVSDEEKTSLFNFNSKINEQDIKTNTFSIFKSVFNKNSHLKFILPEDHVANSLYFEIKTFLHGLMIVGDKLSMANGLEERFPFLDNDLVDFATKIPVRYKLRKFDQIINFDENELKKVTKYFREFDDGKNVLRRAMKSLLPTHIIQRKKQGFSSPDESWFRGENIEYVKDTLLLSNNIKSDKYINKNFIKKTI